LRSVKRRGTCSYSGGPYASGWPQLRRGSIITEAGVHPNVVDLVYVTAHAPDIGEDEGALGKKTPSVLAKTDGAIMVTWIIHLSQPGRFPQSVRA
jgi:hypothetical protein